MKTPVEKRKPSGFVDYVALALTTFGVGYGPIAPGTWGSAVGVLIYLGAAGIVSGIHVNPGEIGGQLTSFQILGSLYPGVAAAIHGILYVLLLLFCLLGIWAAGRSIPLLGNKDPSEAVVDEVMGQLVTFCFVPFGLSWPFILAGFLLFRAFDIWKPYPIRTLEVLPGGLGICADDIVAGVYAGICLAVGYAIYLLV
ncbi:MAG: phosphatidylglycerophosphatase A [Pyrinomonadaceae bacterium]